MFASQPVGRTMSRLLALVGATVGGYLGWYAGAYVGMTTAFMISMVGTGFGMYWGRRLAQQIAG
jgi:hypothetical protein